MYKTKLELLNNADDIFSFCCSFRYKYIINNSLLKPKIFPHFHNYIEVTYEMYIPLSQVICTTFPRYGITAECSLL